MSENSLKLDDSSIRVALVEDDADFQWALTAAIAEAPGMMLAGVASTRAEGLRLLKQAPADVLLVDLGLPDGSGIDVIRAAQAEWPDCAIMVNTVFGDEAHVMRAINAGASGYLLKDSAPEEMVAEIRSLHDGGSPISPRIARQILTRFREPATTTLALPPAARRDSGKPHAALSAREREVLEYISKGFTADEIAGLIAVSRNTVPTYVRRIYKKLEVSSKAEALHEARVSGLLA